MKRRNFLAGVGAASALPLLRATIRSSPATFDNDYAPVSIALAIQVSQEIRSYLRFVAKVGSAVDALLVGETGESAVVTYADEVKVVKPFGGGDTQSVIQRLGAAGKRARAIDAGMQAIRILKARPQRRARVLLFIGQPIDDGSESTARRASVAALVIANELPKAAKTIKGE